MPRPASSMRRGSAALLFLVIGAGVLRAQEAFDPRAPLPSGPEVMRRVREAMPRVRLRVEAELQSKTRVGKIERALGAEMLLEWGATPATASYTIFDMFGEPREKVVVKWAAGAPAGFSYFSGADLEPAVMPDPGAPIEGLDFSWTDLTLSFLWWTEAAVVGVAEKKGRPCFIVDVAGPEDSAEAAYAGVRLWIDAQASVVLEAEGYDRDRTLLRRLTVKSFQKIDELWTIKNLHIQTLPSGHKTTLRVRALDVADEPQG